MSAEAKLRYKVSKKLKIAVGNSKFSSNDKADSTNNDSEKGKKGNFQSSVRGKRFHTAEEGSQRVDRREKIKTINPDRRSKRIYGDQDSSRETMSHDNPQAPYRKASPWRGQNQDAGREKFKTMNSDRRSKRIYGDQDSNWETKSHDNAEGPYRKASPRRGQNQDAGREKFKTLNSDRRSKRIYGDQDSNRETTSHDNAEAPYRKASLRRGQHQVKDGSDNERNGNRSPFRPHLTRRSNELDNTDSEAKRFSRKSPKFSNKTTTKDGFVNGKSISISPPRSIWGSEPSALKSHDKFKPNLSKPLDPSRENFPRTSLPNSRRKVSDKKILDKEAEVIDPQPKKRKRIRLDPHDISNKRFDDTIVMNENKEDKETDEEEKAEISKNAQFRAIQPSPSILSYVEDNLLGRRRMIELKRAGYNIELPSPLDNIPFSTKSEREDIEENIFRNKLTFFAAAKVSSSFPPPDCPEIAFAGRSNVGKSSLLNALTRQWGVVRTSDKPGLTQTINFFNLGSKLSLVDLPGYGFAYAKEEVKDAWEELVKEYVSTRVGLKRVCLLIDTKWGMKPRDHELIDLMERAQTKYQILLTKTDTVFPIDVARRAMQIEERLKASKCIVQPTVMVSAKSGAGIRSLRTVLAKIRRVAKV